MDPCVRMTREFVKRSTFFTFWLPRLSVLQTTKQSEYRTERSSYVVWRNTSLQTDNSTRINLFVVWHNIYTNYSTFLHMIYTLRILNIHHVTHSSKTFRKLFHKSTLQEIGLGKRFDQNLVLQSFCTGLTGPDNLFACQIVWHSGSGRTKETYKGNLQVPPTSSILDFQSPNNHIITRTLPTCLLRQHI